MLQIPPTFAFAPIAALMLASEAPTPSPAPAPDAVYIAIMNHDAAALEAALAAGASPNVSPHESLVSPFQLAFRRDFREGQVILLKYGVIPDAREIGRRASKTAKRDVNAFLEIFAKQGNVESMKALLGSGANVSDWASPSCTTALHHAAECNQIEMLRYLITAGANVNALCLASTTPLILAARHGHGECVKILLQHGAELELSGQRRIKPISIAISSGHLETARLLLEHGATLPLKEGNSQMEQVLVNGKGKLVKFLMEQGVRIPTRLPQKLTLLHVATILGDIEEMRQLLAEDFNPAAETMHGFTALHFAVMNGSMEAVELLLENKTPTHIRDKGGRNALQHAAMLNEPEILRLLIRASDDANPNDELLRSIRSVPDEHKAALIQVLIDEGVLMGESRCPLAAAARFPTACVAQILEAGADPNQENGRGETALFLTPRPETARLLIKAGAKVKTRTHNGATPLLFVVNANFYNEGEQLAIAELLLAEGADPNDCDKKGGNVLEYAAAQGMEKLCRMLLAAGADPRLGNPSRAALSMGFVSIAALLMEHTGEELSAASINAHEIVLEGTAEFLDAQLKLNPQAASAADEYGQTPLHLAVLEDKTEMIQVLLKHGADVNAADKRGRTPLLRAVEEENTELCALLLKAGANPDTADQDGNTPRQLAEESEEIAELFSK